MTALLGNMSMYGPPYDMKSDTMRLHMFVLRISATGSVSGEITLKIICTIRYQLERQLWNESEIGLRRVRGRCILHHRCIFILIFHEMIYRKNKRKIVQNYKCSKNFFLILKIFLTFFRILRGMRGCFLYFLEDTN